MTDSSQTQYGYIKNTTYGTIPATPAFKKMRLTGDSLKSAFQYASGEEIRADRNVSDVTLVGANAGGNLPFELTYGTQDDLIEAALGGTWTANVLKNGVLMPDFTLEKRLRTGASSYEYRRYLGAVINTLSLEMRVNQKVTGSFGIMAQQETSAQAIVTGATYTNADTNPVINAANNFANFTMTGVTAPKIASLQLNISNNLRQQPVLGNVYSMGIGQGRFMVSGSMEAYMASSEFFDLTKGNIGTALSFDLGGVSTKKYNFVIPKIKLTDIEEVAGGNDQDVLARLSFQAYFDDTEAATLKITRTP